MLAVIARLVPRLRFWGVRRKPLPLGWRGENIATRFLKLQGYRVLERNVRLGRYEIDIIAQEGDTVAFVEVKTRRPSDVATPEDNITPTKQRHIRAAANYYISRQDDPEMYYRFDVVCVVLPEQGKPDITLYRDAF